MPGLDAAAGIGGDRKQEEEEVDESGDDTDDAGLVR